MRCHHRHFAIIIEELLLGGRSCVDLLFKKVILKLYICLKIHLDFRNMNLCLFLRIERNSVYFKKFSSKAGLGWLAKEFYRSNVICTHPILSKYCHPHHRPLRWTTSSTGLVVVNRLTYSNLVLKTIALTGRIFQGIFNLSNASCSDSTLISNLLTPKKKIY